MFQLFEVSLSKPLTSEKLVRSSVTVKSRKLTNVSIFITRITRDFTDAPCVVCAIGSGTQPGNVHGMNREENFID